MDNYLATLRSFDGVIGTDFSVLPEMLPDQRNWNITRNAVFAYYLTAQGVPCIPVASWCGPQDFSWCFDAFARDSTIAVSTNGCLGSQKSKDTFLGGIEELVRQKDPWLLVVCGNEITELNDMCRKVLFYPPYSVRMQSRLRGKGGE